MEFIADGEGSGNNAGVTSNNRLKTTGVDLTLTEAAAESGDTYNLGSVATTLTSSGESALFYLKNNEDTNLIIDSFIVNIRDYTGTAGQPSLKVYRNPTSGTIVSGASEARSLNRNYGSKKTLDCHKFTGVEGSTISGEDNSVIVNLPNTSGSTFARFSDISVLPKGASIGLSYTPPSGVTSVEVTLAVTVTLNGTQL